MHSSRGKRIKSWTKDTVSRLFQTCSGLEEISKYLLQKKSFEYVVLGIFLTDPLEKQFSKVRQGSAGNIFYHRTANFSKSQYF